MRLHSRIRPGGIRSTAMAEGAAFVTGGSGFIGGRLIRRLVADGVDVRALARSERSAAAVEEAGAPAVSRDLHDPDPLRPGAAGGEPAVHPAPPPGRRG